jgi:hypothetical protein
MFYNHSPLTHVDDAVAAAATLVDVREVLCNGCTCDILELLTRAFLLMWNFVEHKIGIGGVKRCQILRKLENIFDEFWL